MSVPYWGRPGGPLRREASRPPYEKITYKTNAIAQIRCINLSFGNSILKIFSELRFSSVVLSLISNIRFIL